MTRDKEEKDRIIKAMDAEFYAGIEARAALPDDEFLKHARGDIFRLIVIAKEQQERIKELTAKLDKRHRVWQPMPGA